MKGMKGAGDGDGDGVGVGERNPRLICKFM